MKKNTIWRQCLVWLEEHPIVQMLVRSFLIVFVVEAACRRNPLAAAAYIFIWPHLFIINWGIVATTMSFGLLFGKRTFATVILGCIWLVLGLSNAIVLAFRITPLSAIDFKLLSSVWSIFHNYLNILSAGAIGLGIVAAVMALVILFKRSKKTEPQRKNAVICILALLLMTFVLFHFICGSDRANRDFASLPEAYDKYGTTASFLVSLTDSGIDKPEDYTDEAVDTIKDDLESVPEVDGKNDPDIIMVQLESFFDPACLTNITVDHDPVPVFNGLKEKYSHGMLTVPSIGAGTANTEFEVISGMSLDFFGAGEYPYKTFLQMECCETTNYNLKSLGYTCHAIHNHNGSFYDRNVVYSNLGFDTFTSLEYMDEVELNPLGWADDSVLTDQILKALDSTKGKDFIFTISVQAHGKYPQKPIEGFESGFHAQGFEDEGEQYAFEYYLSQLNQTDEFIEELITALGSRSEKTVLVLYGDHLPNCGLEAEDIQNGDKFSTEYVIWANYPMEQQEKDLYSYQLSSYVLQRLGITVGELTKLHQTMSDDANYQQDLEMLQYDMLYGDRVIYEGHEPYQSTRLRMGLDTILVDSVQPGLDGSGGIVRGQGFTKWSVICVNGRRKDTTFLNKKTLILDDYELKPGDTVQVAQVGTDGQWLSTTNYIRVK